MSVKASNWAWEQKIPPYDKLVLLELADHADSDGICWPRQQLIADRTSIHRVTVNKIIQRLEKQGYLIKENRRKHTGSQRSSLYRLSINEMVFQSSAGLHDSVAQDYITELSGATHIEEPSLEPSIETSHSVAVPTTGTEESDMKQKDEQTVLGILDTGHKSFGPKTKAEIFAKLKYRSGQLTAKSCGHIWTNAVAHASKEDYGHEPEVTIKEQGRLLLAQKRCGGDFAEVVWFVMQDWVGFTVWAEKNSDAFDSPLRPSLGYFQKWAHVAGEYYKEMSKVSKPPTKKVVLPKVQVLTKPNVKVQTKGKMTPEEWAELQKEFESDE